MNLIGRTLDGEEITFDLTDIEAAYPDDGVIYVRGELGAIPVSADSVTTVHEAALKRIARLTAEWNATSWAAYPSSASDGNVWARLQEKHWRRN